MSKVVLFVLIMSMAAGAGAQECSIAPYGDPAGTQSVESPRWNDTIEVHEYSVYVVLHAENTVAAAAYSLNYYVGAHGPFLQNRFTGPGGDGLVLDEPGGTNVALTECVIGFNGNPVLVDEYQFIALGEWYEVETQFELGPNLDQHPQLPQYVTCNSLTYDCEVGPYLIIGFPIPNENRSFSAIKSLYR